MEEWRPLRYKYYQTEDVYEVSTYGRIRRLRRTNSNPDRKCLKYAMRKRDAHGAEIAIVSLSVHGQSLQAQVKNCVVQTFRNDYPGNVRIKHIDGDPANCRLDNLDFARTKTVAAEPRQWIESLLNDGNYEVKSRTISAWAGAESPDLAAAVRGAQFIMKFKDTEAANDSTANAIIEVVKEQIMEHIDAFEEKRHASNVRAGGCGRVLGYSIDNGSAAQN